MGALPTFFPGYQAVTSRPARLKFETAWGARLPEKSGLSACAMLAAAREGDLQALYILGEDLITTESGPLIRRSLEACPFVVVQSILPSETSRYADVLLPGASFAEKTGTFTNTERRIQMVRQAIDQPGDARPDWQIIAELAHRILCGCGREVKSAACAGWDYQDTAQIMNEIAGLAPIYAGISHEYLEHDGGMIWPVESSNHLRTPLLKNQV